MSPKPFSLSACNADYTVSRKTLVSTGAPNLMAKADPTRVCIVFSDNAGLLGFGGADIFFPDRAKLFMVSGGGNPITLNYHDHGPLVQEEWWSARGSGTSFTGVLEVFYRPSGASLGPPEGL